MYVNIYKSRRRLRRENARLAALAREEEQARLRVERGKVEADNVVAGLKLVYARATGTPLNEVVTWTAERVVKEIEKRL